MCKTKVSVCIATYNGSKYIDEQLKSIIIQLNATDEVIIVDDCSYDNTVEHIKNFKDSRIKFISNECNLGVVNSFERAIQYASGDIIFLADQDDVWLPGKIQEVLDCFIEDKTIAVVTDAVVVDSFGKVLHESFFKLRGSGSGVLKNFYKNTYIGCCMAFSAKVKPYILPFPRNTLMHDQWIGSVCNCIGKVIFLNKPLLLYRRHQNNLTGLSRSKWKAVIHKRLIWGAILVTNLPNIYIKFILNKN